MANDIAPDYLRNKTRSDPQFQKALRELPLWAFDKVERIPDPNRGVMRVFGYYDNFDATFEFDPEPLADRTGPTSGMATGSGEVSPYDRPGPAHSTFEAVTSSSVIPEWFDSLSPEARAALQKGDPYPADQPPPANPLDRLRPPPPPDLSELGAVGPDGEILATPKSVRDTRSELWNTARDRDVDPRPMVGMKKEDAWAYLDRAERMRGQFDGKYHDVHRRAFIGQPEPSVDPNARAPQASEGVRFAYNIPAMVARGVVRSGVELNNLIGVTGDEEAAEIREALNEIREAGPLPGAAAVVEEVAQYLPVGGSVFKALRAVKVAPVAAGLISETVASFASFDPQNPHLAELAQGHLPEGTARELNALLLKDPNDPDWMNRARRAAQDLGLGAMGIAFAKGLKGGAKFYQAYRKGEIVWLPRTSRTKNPLTAEEFTGMDPNGFVDPHRVRTAQDTATKKFKDGRKLAKTVVELRANPKKAARIKPIRIVERDGKIWTLDHRRLVSHRLARVNVRYRKVNWEDVESQDFKFSTKDDGMSIRLVKERER